MLVVIASTGKVKENQNQMSTISYIARATSDCTFPHCCVDVALLACVLCPSLSCSHTGLPVIAVTRPKAVAECQEKESSL